MKKIFIVLLISVCFTCMSMSQNDTINIADEISLIKINDNAYIHLSFIEIKNYGKYPCNGFIYINNGKAFLCDSPVSDALTNILIQYLQDSLKLDIIGFAPNHFHIDCMGGLQAIHKKGIGSYACNKTIAIAENINLTIPQNGFEDSLTIKLVDKEIQLFYFGSAHTKDNIVVWVPSEKILFTGCMLKDIKTKGKGNTSDANLNEWPNTLKKAWNRFPNANIVIPGHGAYGGLELFTHTLEILKD